MVVVAVQVARLRGAAAYAAGGAAVVGVEVEVGGHWDAYQVVPLQEALVVGEAGDFAGGLDCAVGWGWWGTKSMSKRRLRLAGRTSFGRPAMMAKMAFLRGRHALPHLADGLDGGSRGAVADGDAEAGGGVRSAPVRAAAGDVAGTAGIGGVAGVAGAGGVAGVAGVGGGAGEAGDFVGGSGQVEDGAQGVGVAEGSQVAAAEVVAEDGVGQGDLETAGGVVTQADMHRQCRCGVGGGAADGVRGVGEAVDEGVDVVGAGGGPGVAGAAMAASVALWAWRRRASLRAWWWWTVPIIRNAPFSSSGLLLAGSRAVGW